LSVLFGILLHREIVPLRLPVHYQKLSIHTKEVLSAMTKRHPKAAGFVMLESTMVQSLVPLHDRGNGIRSCLSARKLAFHRNSRRLVVKMVPSSHTEIDEPFAPQASSRNDSLDCRPGSTGHSLTGPNRQSQFRIFIRSLQSRACSKAFPAL
jgi:hypothetical protein